MRDPTGRLMCYTAAAMDVTERLDLRARLEESENRLDMASSAAGAFLWELDVPTGALQSSAQMYHELDYTDWRPTHRDEMFKLMHPRDVSKAKHDLEAHLDGRASLFKAEYRLRTKKGAWLWFKSTGKVIERDKEGAPLRLLGLSSDITQRKQAVEALRRSERNLLAILKASPVGVAVLRPDGAILFSNDRFAQMTNIDPHVMQNTRIQSFYADPQRHEDLMALYNAASGVSDEEAQLKLPGKQNFWALLTMSPIVYEGRQSILFWTYDISELKKAEAQLRELATTDGLTGVYNRRYFLELATRELSLSQRNNRKTALLMLDADRFKSINDTYGHDVGDLVLKSLCAVCREILRDVDVFGRLGGEEFAVFLPETTKEGAVYAAERLRRALADARVPIGSQELQYTVSIGVAAATEATSDVESMLKAADTALYAAKQKGRNRVETS